MRRSKLEIYISILSVLAQRGPLKLTHIMQKANLNCNVVKDNLDFLIKKELITERTLRRDNKVFAITQSGINVLKYFKEITKALLFIEETRSQPTEHHFCTKSREPLIFS